MIRHIVLWKLDKQYNPEEKEEICRQITKKLQDLKNHVDTIKLLEVSRNDRQAPDSNYDIMLNTLFDGFEELEAYQIHPEHLKAAGYLKSLKLERAAIDIVE